MYLFMLSRVCDPAMGMVFYVDREGQNAFQQRVVPRDDDRVLEAITEARAIMAMPDAPPRLMPNIKTGKATKTKGFPVTMAQPWNCDYCDYCDVSCPGALQAKDRKLGVVGHINVNGPNGFIGTKEIPLEIAAYIQETLTIPF
jgi:hypothetical protein